MASTLLSGMSVVKKTPRRTRLAYTHRLPAILTSVCWLIYLGASSWYKAFNHLLSIWLRPAYQLLDPALRPPVSYVRVSPTSVRCRLLHPTSSVEDSGDDFNAMHGVTTFWHNLVIFPLVEWSAAGASPTCLIYYPRERSNRCCRERYGAMLRIIIYKS